MKNIQKFLFFISTVVMNGFLLSDQQNIFAGKMAIRGLSNDFFEIAQHCNNRDLANKKGQRVMKKLELAQPDHILSALQSQNNLNQTPSMVALEQFKETQSQDCISWFAQLRLLQRQIMIAQYEAHDELDIKESLMRAGVIFEESKEDNRNA